MSRGNSNFDLGTIEFEPITLPPKAGSRPAVDTNSAVKNEFPDLEPVDPLQGRIAQEDLDRIAAERLRRQENKKENGKDSEESLDDISVSEADIDTKDKIFCQYVKVKRTKQRYR